MGLIQELASGPVALDTSIFIYYLEQNPTFIDEVRPVFAAVSRGELEIVTSAVTLLEVLVVPYRSGDSALAARYEELFRRGQGLQLVEIDEHQLRWAAQLRARYSVRTPDALQLAAALSAGCTAFVTNDRRLPEVRGIRLIGLTPSA